MPLGPRKVEKIIDRIEDSIEQLEDLSWTGDPIIKVKDVEVGDGFVYVDFRVIAQNRDENEIEDTLNLFNRVVDGPAGAGNPSIDFDDETPATPLSISDTFRLQYTVGSGLDFTDT